MRNYGGIPRIECVVEYEDFEFSEPFLAVPVCNGFHFIKVSINFTQYKMHALGAINFEYFYLGDSLATADLPLLLLAAMGIFAC